VLFSRSCGHNLEAEDILETIKRVSTNTIGYMRKQTNKEWFDEERAKVNEEKNAARENFFNRP
jgi:hypothetical protein